MEAAATTAEPLALHHSLIAGAERVGSAGERRAVEPATGRAFARVSLLDNEQAGSAVAAAQAALPAWRRLPFAERSRLLLEVRGVLLKRAAEIARLIAREQGKPVSEAYAVEILPCLDALKHLSREAEAVLKEEVVEGRMPLLAHKDSRILYGPVGVVLVITPWNYPLGIPLLGVATALAAGNTVVLKPAPATSLVGLAIGEICRAAGLPDGVVNVVVSADDVAASLVEDDRLGKIVFTGSVATGKRVMAAAAHNLTPVVLELGGKDPAIVCRDADLERAARGLVWGAFVNAGQTCASVERVYVEAPVAEALLVKLVEQAGRLRVGDPLQAGVDVGPMTMERQRRVVEEHVADAVSRGARILLGGATPKGPGFFYPPTLLAGVDHTMRIMREETFGPVLPVMRAADLDQAIALANESPYGLTASGWTSSAVTARRLQEELVAGVVSINDCLSSFGEPSAPWGGCKASGFGRSHGAAGLREMVQAKYASWDRPGGSALWWYPYDADFAGVMADAGPALHARGLVARLRSGLRLLGSRRFRARVRLRDLLKNADRLF